MDRSVGLSACLAHFIPWDNGKIWVSPHFIPVLQAAKLTTRQAFLEYSQGQKCKQNQYREVIRLELPDGSRAYLKRHWKTRFLELASNWLCGKIPASPARQELEACIKLKTMGISSMEPIAFGEVSETLGPGPCFLLTQEVLGMKLEQYLRDPQSLAYRSTEFRHKIIYELARIARTMHQNGLHHQDFYLGHLLLCGDIQSQNIIREFKITLIDLQRVRQQLPLPNRWKIKDLAQLNYSASLIPSITLGDRFRFWLEYFQKDFATDEAKVMIRCILAKTQRIAHHDKKLQARKKKLAER